MENRFPVAVLNLLLILVPVPVLAPVLVPVLLPVPALHTWTQYANLRFRPSRDAVDASKVAEEAKGVRCAPAVSLAFKSHTEPR
jgi:hypothetical protein